jgi:N-glycosylase/DNA lyase
MAVESTMAVFSLPKASTSLRASTNRATPVTPSPKKQPRKRKAMTPEKPTSSSSPKTTSTPSASTTPVSASVWTRRVVEAINPNQPYLDLEVPPEELRPSATLTTGQSFVWKVVVDDEEEEASVDGLSSTATPTKASPQQSAWGSHDATEWVGILRIRSDLSVVMAIKETPTTTLYRPLSSTADDSMDWKQILRCYFQLDHSLPPLYETWSQTDPRLATIAKCIPGVRILDQDPWECLVSFICSSNNNIPRITKMVNAIRREYGQPLLPAETCGSPETLYSFPSVDELAEKVTDQDLREKCGLGYRSKYILETIQLLQDKGGESYLQELRQLTDPLEVQTKLCEFCGVGRKVADCVALFSLRQMDAIPVDVHVWNIARRDYDPDNQLAKIKSLTPTTYKQVGDVFRERFPSKAGWAHSLLFVAELPSFRAVLPKRLVKEMQDFQREEKLRKQEAKEAKTKRAKVEE